MALIDAKPLVASCLLLLGALPAAASAAAADSVELSNGRALAGAIVREDEHSVSIRTTAGRVDIPRDRIAAIHRGDGANGAMLALDQALQARSRAERLFAAVSDAAEADPSATASRLAENGPAIVAAAASATNAERASALLLARRATRMIPAGEVDALWTLARAFEAMDAAPDAVDALLGIDRDALAAHAGAGPWAESRLLARARRLAAAGESEQALALAEAAHRLSDSTDAAVLLALGAARSARERGDFAEALHILRARVAGDYPAVARARARDILRDARAAAMARRDYGPALALARGDAMHLAPDEAERLAAEMATAWARAELAAGRPEEALEIASSARPRGEALARLEEQARVRIAIRDADEQPIALFEAAQDAARRGFDEEAAGAFRVLRRNAELRPLADEQLRLLARRDDQAMLARAIDAFDDGRMDDAWNAAQAVLNNPDRSTKAAEEAREIAELAKAELNMDLQSRPYEAEMLYQEAERALLAGNASAAWKLVDTVLTDYASTPAAGRADALLPDVAREFRMLYLEGVERDAAAWRLVESRLAPDAGEGPALRRADPSRAQLERELERLLAALEGTGR